MLSVLVSAALLLWPAALNRYPLLFGDTPVYVYDGLHLHGGWPRPIFYGLFLRALDWQISTWPVVAGQALIAATMLRLVLRAFLPGSSPWVLIPVTAILAFCTSLPWFASQLMPDLFGALMVLSLALLLLAPDRLAGPVRVLLVLFAAGCIAMHQSYLLTSIGVAMVLLLIRAVFRQVRWADAGRGFAVPVLAVLAIIGANAVLLGQASLSPYGKIFIMTRAIFDGPGKRALLRECPRPDWTLCAEARRIPPTVEDFLFGPDSTLERAGGYRVVAPQAWPIVVSAFQAEPGAMLLDAARNAATQFVAFRSGDWLNVPIPGIGATWRASFPAAEADRLGASRQQRMLELLPDWLQAVHLGVGAVSILVLAGGLLSSWSDRCLAGLYAAILTGLVVNAATTGALSGVYDRYQSRFMWLPVFAGLLMLLSWWQGLDQARSIRAE